MTLDARVLYAHETGNFGALAAHDGQLYAGCLNTGRVLVFDLATGRERLVFTDAPGVTSLAAGPDRALYVGNAWRKHIVRCALGTGASETLAAGFAQCVHLVASSEALYTGGGVGASHAVYRTDLRVKKKTSLGGKLGPVISLTDDPRGLLVTTNSTRTQPGALWRLAPGADTLTRLADGFRFCRRALWGPDGAVYFAAEGAPEDPSLSAVFRLVEGEARAVYARCFDPRGLAFFGARLVGVGFDGSVFEVSPGQPARALGTLGVSIQRAVQVGATLYVSAYAPRRHDKALIFALDLSAATGS